MRTGQGIQHTTAVREQQLVDTKHEDMRYMQEQRERLKEEEHRRMAQLAAQRVESQRQQRVMITIVLVGIGIAIIAGTILVLIATNSPTL